MITWAQLGLQDANSPIIEEFIYFHDFAIVVLTFIIRAVTAALVGIFSRAVVDRGLLEGQAVECIWTLLPGAVLVQLAIPSLLLLYIVDERGKDSLIFKAIGHQWYWRYEYNPIRGQQGLEFDSYMSSEESLARLLDTDNRVVLPYRVRVGVIVGSADVLHAWTVPALGVKVDACPGRLNRVRFISHRPGIQFGQCREICGANHRFMPISLEFVSTPDWAEWIKTAI